MNDTHVFLIYPHDAKIRRLAVYIPFLVPEMRKQMNEEAKKGWTFRLGDEGDAFFFSFLKI